MATKVLIAASEKGKDASEGQVAATPAVIASRPCEWTTPGGIQMHCYNPLEVSFLWEKIFAENEYGDGGIVYPPGAIIVDVGGNVGVFCHYADARCAGECTIIAIEPIPQLFHCLQKNVKALRANCSLHNVAAGASTECDPITLDFLPRYSLLSGSQAHSNCAGYEKLAELHNLPLDLVQEAFESVEVECPQSTLSDILQQEAVSRIDLLKVDCEGAEYDVMLGISETDWPKIQQVTCSCSPFLLIGISHLSYTQ